LLLTAKELLDGIQIGKETRAKATTSQNTAGRSKKEKQFSASLIFSGYLFFAERKRSFTRSSFTTKTLQRQEEEQARIRKTHEYHQASKSLDARITSRQQQKGFRI